VATVHLPSTLTPFTGGESEIDVDAGRVVELLAAISARFPDLASQLDDFAVAIDGVIFQDPGYQPVQPSSDVHLVPRIAGG